MSDSSSAELSSSDTLPGRSGARTPGLPVRDNALVSTQYSAYTLLMVRQDAQRLVQTVPTSTYKQDIRNRVLFSTGLHMVWESGYEARSAYCIVHTVVHRETWPGD